MGVARWVTLALLGACIAEPARAQSQDPVGPFVVEVRGVTTGLPTTTGWTVPVPAGALVPSRGFGGEAGAHVYVGRLGPARLGLGAALGLARGTASPAEPAAAGLRVVARATTLAPQLSLNFGHRLGWSHLSAGLGGARVTSRVGDTGTAGAVELDTGWVRAVNVGGGARWFLSDHIGVGFDLRWHRLSAPSGPTAEATRATLFQLGFGVTLQ